MLIGLTGYAGAGKNATADILVARNEGWVQMAFADALRDMAVALDPYVHCGQPRHFTEGSGPFARYTDVLRAVGYQTAKSYPDVRRMLQRLGTEAVRGVLGDNTFVDEMMQRVVLSEAPHIVITDVRFENEAATIRAAGGYIVRVCRPGVERVGDHASEAAINAIATDVVISGGHNLEQLKESVKGLLSVLAEQEARQQALLDSTTEAQMQAAQTGRYTLQPSVPTEPDVQFVPASYPPRVSCGSLMVSGSGEAPNQNGVEADKSAPTPEEDAGFATLRKHTL